MAAAHTEVVLAMGEVGPGAMEVPHTEGVAGCTTEVRSPARARLGLGAAGGDDAYISTARSIRGVR